MTANGRHLSDNPDWRTPQWLVNDARLVMGGIDLDPMSDHEANATIGATRILTVEDDGLAHEWHGRIFINPAGPLFREAWRHLVEEYLRGHVTQAIWVGFSLEQLQTLQVGAGASSILPLDFTICYPKARVKFEETPEMTERRRQKHAARVAAGLTTTKFNPRSSPGHASYVCYLGPRVGAFYRTWLQHGAVVVPAVAVPRF